MEKNMRRIFPRILMLTSVVVLIAVTAFALVSCKSSDKTTTEPVTITVEVIGKTGEHREHVVTTEKTNLADAVTEAGFVEGENDIYGLYITTVDGEVADYSVDCSYWALSKGGEVLMSGASDTAIANGEHYEFTYTVVN